MQKKYCLFGIIGALCFGVGDWLLGFVDTIPVDSAYDYIAVGHQFYPSWKISVIMVLAGVGIFFLMSAFSHIGEIAKEQKYKDKLNYGFTMCGCGWLFIHFFFTVIVFGYGWLTQNGEVTLAASFSQDLAKALTPSQCLAYVMVGFPFIEIIDGIRRKKTKLPKKAIFFTPLTWMIIIDVISEILPTSAFSKGLFTFSMNLSLIIWFVYLASQKKVIEE